MATLRAGPPDELALADAPGGGLRRLTSHDWPLEQALSRVADVPRWTYYPPDLSDDDARERVRVAVERDRAGITARYVVLLDGKPVGTAGVAARTPLAAEVFYALLPVGRGHGLATCAVVELATWGFGAGYHEVRLATVVGNEASEAVAARAGFRAVGTQVQDDRTTTLWVRSRDGSP
ncbi:GNAT family N-acetyltransferase [Oerskovia flava]|uniref:GNAT family N-acetyltransferase n=1 Tax=Oerskovia flava TaxID=2986422 RepID=UPI002240DF8F|nr:GNAT family N-acetyltransferase [Oerskovia sp. JB1-3-2]